MGSGAVVTRCTACERELPADAAFCGFCGFRLAPISRRTHRTLSQTLPPLEEDAPLLLTKPKRSEVYPAQTGAGAGSRRREKSRLEVVEAPSSGPAAGGSGQRAVTPIARLKVAPAPAQRSPGQGGSDFEAPAPRQPRAPVKPDPRFKASRDRRLPTPSPRESNPAMVKRRGETDRLFRRYPLKVEVNFSSEHNFYTGFMVNMSSGGLFVATHEPSPIGELIEITFSVPGLESYTAVCRVRWIREYDPDSPDMVPGMGLQFSQLEPEARAAIELFITHRDTIFFDDE